MGLGAPLRRPGRSMMKVLHVISGLGTGGAEVALCRLLESMNRREFRHSVVSLSRNDTLGGRVRASGADLKFLNLVPSRPNPMEIVRLRKTIQLETPSVIHGWMYHGNLGAALAARTRAAPLIWGIRHSLHDLRNERVSTRAAIRAGAWLSARPQTIVYNSHTSAGHHEAIGYSAAHRRVIPNGFDTESFKPDSAARARVRAELAIPSNAVVVGHVARWHPVKDHGNLLRAAQLLLRSRENTLFVLVGEGVDASNRLLTEQLHQLGIASKVRLCGRRSDIAAVNAAFDIAAVSSRGEAFPNAIGEAMACGVPCVTTDVGDAREIVGSAGVVVPPSEPEALCAGWRQILDLGDAGRNVLGESARRRILQFYSLAACMDAYRDLYHQIGR